MKNILAMVAALSLLVGCIENRKTAGELMNWVECPDNGLQRSKELNGFEIEVQHRPVDYIICSEFRDAVLTSELYAKRKEELNGMEYYRVRLRAQGTDPLLFQTTDQNIYHARNNYLMFDQKADISMVRNNDTIPCAMYHFVNYQGLAPYADVLIGFAADSTATGDHELIYNDQLFGFGPLHYTFTEDELKSVPALELN